MTHLDGDAELYALGLTEPERAAEIEAHLTTCAACCERVAAAESAAASLAAALPPMPVAAAPRRRTWWPQLAAAAAVVFAATTALEGSLLHNETSRVQRTYVALTALASTHFAHTTLTSSPGLIAKAIYSRDGAWAYVLASGAPAGAHVVLRQGATHRDLGPMDDGTPATLFIHRPGRGEEYDIVAGGTVIAHGKPVY